MGLPIKKNAKSLPDAKSLPTQGKAKEILHHGEVRGKPITTKQRGLMGIIVAGKVPKKMK